MLTHRSSVSVMSVLLAMASGATAQTQPATLETAVPATAPAEEAVPRFLVATVTGLEGRVQVREAEDQPWKMVQVGMEVSQGAEFRTGPHSAVRLVIPPDQIITLDRLGTMKLIEAVQTGNKVKTDLGMKYGRTRYEIEAAGLEHESKIASPNSTLAVRGTKTTVFDQPPFAPEAVVITGRVDYKRAGRGNLAFGQKGRRTSVSATTNDPADESLRETFVDSGIANARTQAEREILLVQSRGSYTVNSQLVAASGLMDFIAAADFSSNIDAETNRSRETPGTLSFDLVWQGAADLDLFVQSPRSERLSAFPFTLSSDGVIANSATNNVPSGGRIEFDDQGPNEPGAALNGGRETAYWSESYPTGKYTIKINYIEGPTGGQPQAASYVLTVRDGSDRNAQVFTGTINPADKSLSIPVPVAKQQ